MGDNNTTLGRLENIKNNIDTNNTNFTALINKIKGIMQTTKAARDAIEEGLKEQIKMLQQTTDTNANENTKKDAQIVELNNRLKQEEDKTLEINRVIGEIEEVLGVATKQIQDADGEINTLTQQPTSGGKSSKRKNNKKHFKNKSRKIRNKKHKSK
jgi:chromosome segregation ATPase